MIKILKQMNVNYPSENLLQDPNYSIPLYDQINNRGHLRLMAALNNSYMPPLNLKTTIEGIEFEEHNDRIISDLITENDSEWKNRERIHLLKSEIKTEEENNKNEKENFIAHSLALRFHYECSTGLLKVIMKNEEIEKAKKMIEAGNEKGFAVAGRVGIFFGKDLSYSISIGDIPIICFKNYCEHMVRTKALIEQYKKINGKHLKLFETMYARDIKWDVLYDKTKEFHQ